MARSKATLIIVSIGLLGVLLIAQLVIRQHYLLASICFMIATAAPLIIRFERKKVEGRELVLLAILAAVAAVSRIPFASLPSVQPTTFVIIMAGVVFGAESGFVVGALAALVSNLFLGQGPWTPWQMYGWGMIGLAAGLLSKPILRNKLWRLCVFGFIAGFFFGWVQNLWLVLSVIEESDWKALLALYGTSFYFDLAHALSNVFFLLLFARGWMRILRRFKIKYGLLS